MLEILLSSRVRAKVLATIFLTPGESHNAWGLAQRLSENYSAVWKELVRLEKSRILISEKRGNSKDYRVNEECPIAPDLRSIVLKTEGVGRVITEKLRGLDSVKMAFIFGSYASGEADARSDLDLMIVGKINLEQLAPLISEVERELNRPINYVIHSEDEWNEKLALENPFLINVSVGPKIMLIGGDHAL